MENFKRSGKRIYNPNKYGFLDAGISFIIFTVIMFSVSLLIRYILPKTGAFYEYMKSDYGFNVTISILIAQALVFLVSFIYSRIRKVSYLSGGGYTFKFDAINTSMGCLLVLGVYLLFATQHMQISDNFKILFPYKEPNTDGHAFWAILVNLVLSPLLPAIVEEGFMRGIVYRSLEGYGKWFAIITSALIFAIFHGNPEQLFLQFLGGVCLAFALSLTKNFFVPCFMHFFYNLSIIFVEATKLIAEERGAYALAIVEIALPFLGLVFVTIAISFFVNKALKQKNSYKHLDNRSVVLFDKEQNLITELNASCYEQIEQELTSGKYFLCGKSFIKAKKSNKKAGIILLILAVVVGVIDVSLSVIL